MKRGDIIKGSVTGGAVNAIINGVINWFTIRGAGEIFLAQDLISSQDKTVFAGIVPLAASLAFMLTTVSYFTFKFPGKPRYFPKVFLWAIRNSFFAFGLMITIAIMVQRFAADVTVTPVISAILAGITAGVIGTLVDYMTKSQIVGESKS